MWVQHCELQVSVTQLESASAWLSLAKFGIDTPWTCNTNTNSSGQFLKSTFRHWELSVEIRHIPSEDIFPGDLQREDLRLAGNHNWERFQLTLWSFGPDWVRYFLRVHHRALCLIYSNSTQVNEQLSRVLPSFPGITLFRAQPGTEATGVLVPSLVLDYLMLHSCKCLCIH